MAGKPKSVLPLDGKKLAPRRIGREDIRLALRMLEEGVTGEIRDTALPRFSIRVRRRLASWDLHVNVEGIGETTRKVADVNADDDPEVIRNRAQRGRLMARQGLDPEEFFARDALGDELVSSVIKASQPEKPPEPRVGWTWEQGRDEYLEHIKLVKSPKTYVDYRGRLTSPWLRHRWDGRMLAEITDDDVKKLQDEAWRAGKGPQAHHLVGAVNRLLKWCSGRGGAGIKASVAEGVPLIELPGSDGPYVPEATDLEQFAWKLQRGRHTLQAKLAAVLMALTVVRRETLLTARVADFREAPRAGGGLWTPSHLKTKVKRRTGENPPPPTVLPLPPFSWAVVQRLIEMSAGSPWLLPQLRVRREGGPSDGHLSGGVIDAAVSEALPRSTNHDLRRALATRGVDEGLLSKGEAAEMLTHTPVGVPTVTMKYSLTDGSHARWRPARAWNDWLAERIRAGAPPEGPAWPPFLPEPVDTRTPLDRVGLLLEALGLGGGPLSDEERARLIETLAKR